MKLIKEVGLCYVLGRR